MYEAYFTRRLLESLALADEAPNSDERSIHLQASRYYRDLLKVPEKREHARHGTQIRATLHHLGVQSHRVTVTDLSTGGFRASLDVKVRPGSAVAVEMDGFAPIDAFAVWQEGDQVGFKFVCALHPAIVDAAVALGS